MISLYYIVILFNIAVGLEISLSVCVALLYMLQAAVV